jgi:hypothetical protein
MRRHQPHPLFRTRFVHRARARWRHFNHHMSQETRFVLTFACGALAAAYGYVFHLLPDGWPMAVMAHLDTLPGAIIAVMLLAYSMTAAACVLLAQEFSSKLRRNR